MSVRLNWIDTLKAICMICVYIAHTEAFTTGSTMLSKAVLPFYVNAFFFISGYLLYKKYLQNDIIENFSFSTYKRGILNCLFKLAIPTIIFSILIYLPKILFHGNSFDLSTFAIEILGGTSFWFTSALFVAQLLLLTLFLTKRKNIFFYLGITTIVFIFLQYLCDYKTKPAIEYFPWFWRTGLNYSLIMSLGGLYTKYEDKLKCLTIIAMAISIAGYYMLYTGRDVACLGLSGRCNIIGFFTSIATTLVLIEIAKRIKANKAINFIGKNSILFYFFSGAIPATFSALSTKFNINDDISLITTLVLSLISSYVITYIIVKYLPFLTDIRLINNVRNK
ncbi:MAG: acyltransferase family protein [Bacteroidaceae bacterium]|nr:acyltransferase family protein [Bacteroidaceae bacterium]